MNKRLLVLSVAGLASLAGAAVPKAPEAPAASEAPAPPVPVEAPAAQPRPPARRPLMARLFEKRYDRRLLRDGERAVAVPLEDYQLLAVRTGDHVDLLSVFDARGEKRTMKLCATVLQNVRVVGVELSAAGPGKGALLLRLNPNEAQLAVLSARQGDLAVAVRGDGDRKVYPMEMADYGKMFR